MAEGIPEALGVWLSNEVKEAQRNEVTCPAPGFVMSVAS
jgi:hypothetical protein